MDRAPTSYRLLFRCLRGYTECPSRAAREWSRGRESNSRPADYESAALPLSYLGLGGDSYLSIRGKLVSILRRDRCAIHGPLDSYPGAKVNALPRKESDLQQRRGLAGSIVA